MNIHVKSLVVLQVAPLTQQRMKERLDLTLTRQRMKERGIVNIRVKSLVILLVARLTPDRG